MDVDKTLIALADPTRRAIVEHLAMHELSVNDLAAPFGLSQPTISHHLKVLSDGGIVVKRSEGTRRLYRLDVSVIDDLEIWLSQLRKSMEHNYQRLDALLLTMKGEK